MVESNKKNLWMGLGAFGALVAAALIYNYVSGDDGDDDEGSTPTPQFDASELMKELAEKDLTNVKRKDGMLETDYFLRLLNFIGATNKKRTEGDRSKTTKQRRKHFQAKEWDEYSTLVQNSFLEEDRSAQAVMSEVNEALGISMMEFQQMHQTLMSNQVTGEAVMHAQRGSYAPPDLKKKPTLSKQKTMEVFKHTQKLSVDMMEMLRKLEQEAGDEQTKMLKFMVEQLKMHDQIFFDTEVENEDFEDSLMFFMRTDPTVQKEIQAYMMKMQQDVMKKQAGK